MEALCNMCEEKLEMKREGDKLIIEPCPTCASDTYPTGVTIVYDSVSKEVT